MWQNEMVGFVTKREGRFGDQKEGLVVKKEGLEVERKGWEQE